MSRSLIKSNKIANVMVEINKRRKPTKLKIQNDARLDGKGDPLRIVPEFKFDHTRKWYMYKLESVPENEVPKIPYDFKTQTDHLIPTRRPNLVLTKKKMSHRFYRFAGRRSENQRQQKARKILGPRQRTKKLLNMRVTVIQIVVGALGTVLKGL